MKKLVLLMFGVLTLGIAADFAGKWKLNVEKSKLPPKSPVVSEVMSIENPGGDKIRYTWDFVETSGEKKHAEDLLTCDGSEYPLSRIGAGFTGVCEKITDTSYRFLTKKDGKTILERTNTLSGDGKVITVKQRSTTRSGNVVDATLLYERQ